MTKKEFLMKKHLLTLALITFSSMTFADSHDAHWGYEGNDSPEHWGKLSPDYALCSTGKNQSPINITQTLEAETPKITINYTQGGYEVINNGHTIQVNVNSGSSITLQGHTYQLKQFHFHAPSENEIDGKSYPLEAHFVHADDKGNLAVIGVMFKIGKENSALKKAWANMPAKAGDKAELVHKISAISLLPNNKDYYRFNGSLTTPPCSEGVTWLVMKKPMTVSQAQLEQFTKVMGHPNNRPVQPVNARPVLK
jgi:carbonic anhydrase